MDSAPDLTRDLLAEPPQRLRLNVGQPPVRRGNRLPPWGSRGFGFSLLVYLVSRIPVVIGLAVILWSHPGENLTSVALRADGWWYLHIARSGYTTSLRPVLAPEDFHHRYSDWAFYPGYPVLIRGSHELTSLSYLTSSLVAASVLGLTAVWAMHTLGYLFGGVPVARATALLFAMWPGSAAFSLPYSESLFVTATALALIFLHTQRWLLLGVFGAVALFTRPTGLALLAAITVVALIRFMRERDWRPLAAAAVTAAGGAAFVVYGWARTGDVLVWRHAENLWGQRLDFSTALLTRSLPLLADPLSALRDPTQQRMMLTTLLDLFGLLMLLLMAVAVLLTRRRTSTAMVVYAIATAAMIVGSSAVASRPRMVLAVLPGFVWLAAWLPPRLVVALSACFMVLLGVTTYLWWRVTP